MASEAVLNLNESNFQTEISSSTVPVIVDFWAEWCGPCRMLTPILEQLAAEKGSAVKVAKVNLVNETGKSRRFGKMTDVRKGGAIFSFTAAARTIEPRLKAGRDSGPPA